VTPQGGWLIEDQGERVTVEPGASGTTTIQARDGDFVIPNQILLKILESRGLEGLILDPPRK